MEDAGQPSSLSGRLAPDCGSPGMVRLGDRTRAAGGLSDDETHLTR